MIIHKSNAFNCDVLIKTFKLHEFFVICHTGILVSKMTRNFLTACLTCETGSEKLEINLDLSLSFSSSDMALKEKHVN